MAGPTREAVYAALFAKLQAIGATFGTYSRRIVLPGQLDASLLTGKVLMLYDAPEDTQAPHRIPNRVWGATIVLAFINPDRGEQGDPTTGVAGATILNPLIDAVEAALAPDNPASNSLTLGGLVEYCRIDGRTIRETGDTDPAGLGGAVIPIKIRVP